MAQINIGGTLHSTALGPTEETSYVVANANEILDDTNYTGGKKQSVINASILNGDIYKTINGQPIIGEGNIYTSTDSYVVCNTAADVAIKEVVVDNYQLANGGNIRIKFTYANTATDVSLKIKASAGDTSAVSKRLYYSGNPVSSTNTWSNNETVAVYYDGTNYMANNVAGAELKNTIDTTNPDTKKGVTEDALVNVLGDVEKSGGSYIPLQEQIYAITASSSTVTIGLYNDGQHSTAITRFIQPIVTEGEVPTEELSIRGTCNPAKAKMTLYKSEETTSSYQAIANTGDTAVNSSESMLYWTVEAEEPYTYYFYIRNNIYTAVKDTSVLTITYVQPLYYGALPTETEGEDPQPIVYTIDDLIGLNGHDKQLTQYSSATTASRRTYSIPFDTRARKVYMVVPKKKVSTILTNAVYWESAINSNLMPFSRVTSLENNDYYVYVSDNTYNVAEGTESNRNIIFN